ncbi:hypothetical protein FISHEDRAFT_44267 [Fistulina hepatica ATCC 64428]|uniref:CxC1-like cysteine cluster associated with KDZ transposases domain-containing protein n=1 Tax=Fistulina hepatica ATCC 64428 TaxID=1128425 RepID=A0A0D7AAD0_9AGAR|nr:hypothetical protein FISHEDRAFT_44267 [Fistulina hepatica ATCC 64428]
MLLYTLLLHLQISRLTALPATERLDFIEHELHGDGDMWEDDDAAMQQSAFSIPPPGEEGSEFSNAGAEGALFTIVHSMVGRRRHRIDMRTRHDRVQKQINGWGRQLPALKSAYLHWKVHGTPVEEASDLVAPTFSIMVYSFRGIRQEFFCSSAGSASINETLVLHGLIGSAPETPRVAFTFNFLETFRQLHRVCPRLSLDAVARTLHNLHQRPRKPYLTQQLSNAYDVYLSIQRAISADAQSALKRDPTIQAQLLCPPCMYRLEQEMPLQPSMLVACDGNNSLKLVDATFLAGDRRSDDRRLPSFRFLEPEVVDKFKDDVSNAAAAKTTRTSMPAPPSIDLPNTRTDEVPWIEAHELGRAFEQQVDACVERWRAAGSDAKKKTVELFAIAGVFLTVCRHGHVLIMCDMIRSGEL